MINKAGEVSLTVEDESNFSVRKNIHEHICTGVQITIPFISRLFPAQDLVLILVINRGVVLPL